MVVEHGLEVERGADGLADLAERPELPDRAGQLPRPRLQLPEQANILDRDDGLVGEGLEQLDLGVGERRGLGLVDVDRANGKPIAQHRDGEDASEFGRLREGAVLVLGIRVHIGDAHDRPGKNGPAGGEAPAGTAGVDAAKRIGPFRPDLGLCREVDQLAIKGRHDTAGGATESQRGVGDAIEHRLDVGRRARDDPQDLRRRGLLLQRFGQVSVARLQLLEKTDVLDRDDGLVGEGLHELDLILRKRSLAGDHDGTERAPVADHRRRQHGTIVVGSRDIAELVLGIQAHIGNVNDRAIENGPTRIGATRRPSRESLSYHGEGFGARIVRRDEPLHLAIEQEEVRVERVAQPDRTLGDRVEHGLHVRRRARDHLEDLARRRQVPVAGLQLLEQADVLDCDDALVGERRDQLDLLVGEGLDLVPPEREHPDGHALPQHRDPQDRPVTSEPDPRVCVVGIGQHVLDLNRPALEHRPAHDAPAAGAKGVLRDEALELGRDVARGRQPLQLAIEPVDDAGFGTAEPGRVLDERLEDGLEIERRATDDLQDFAGGGLLLQRVGQVPVPGLELLEQAHVLDGDDRLVGEGLQQLDLLVRERPGLGATRRRSPRWGSLREASEPPACFDSPGLGRARGTAGALPGRSRSRAPRRRCGPG